MTLQVLLCRVECADTSAHCSVVPLHSDQRGDIQSRFA